MRVSWRIIAVLALAVVSLPVAAEVDLEALNARVSELHAAGAFAEAVPLARQSLERTEAEFGSDSIEVAVRAGWLGSLHKSLGEYELAEPLYKRALAIYENTLGSNHPDTALSLNNLAELYDDQGQYAQAEPFYKQALAIREKALGSDHPDTATSLNNLALLYYSQGQYAQADPLFKRALAIGEKVLGPDHPQTATILHNLALLCRDQGQHARAESLFKQALAIYEKSLGPDHPDTATSLNQLAVLYNIQGQYAQVEPLIRRTLAIREKSFGSDHPRTALSLRNLADLYEAQGQYAQAQPLYERVLAISEQALGPDHPETATSLLNLAALSFAQGRYAQAEPLYERALAIYEKVLGPDHPSTATSLNNLAVLYEAQGQYARAEPLHERALAIREKVLGPDHMDTATSLNNLAVLYDKQSRYDQAEPFCKRALVICEKVFGPDHPKTAMSLRNLAGLQAALGCFLDAVKSFDHARRGTRRHVARVLPSLSAAEQALFLRTQDEGNFHSALSIGLLQRAAPDIAALSAGWLANGKAVGHGAAAQQIILARQSEIPATQAAVAALTGVRADLGRLTQMTPVPEKAVAYRAKLAELQAEEHRLVHEIGGQLAALDRDEPWVEIDEIRRNIPAGSVLVDFARFGIVNFATTSQDSRWQPARYAAWITPAAGAGDVTIVDLGDAAETDGLVADYRRAIEARLVDLPAAEPLAAKVLRPILAALPSGGGKVEELILSPDGALWLVPWQALPIDDGSFAIERYAIRTVTSARDLVPPSADAAPRGEASPPLLVADPAFDEPPLYGGESPGDGASAVLPAAAGRVLPKVAGLAATRGEAEAARGPLAKVAGATPVVRVGREATAAGVQREAVRPQALVLATHGFFLPDQEVKHDDRIMLADTRGIAGARPLDEATGRPVEDPLLRCGLLFAGANLPATTLPAGDDGVLTGAEIVGLDLLGTDLVVLSACDTGVGRVNVGEGVAGLRQAFQIAGAKTVVATLWQVPDEESAAIMTAFYAHLAAGQPPSQSLRTAQLAFIKARRERGGTAADHPYFWAAYGTTGR